MQIEMFGESAFAAAPLRRDKLRCCHWLACLDEARAVRREVRLRTYALRRDNLRTWLANRSSRTVGKCERRLAGSTGLEPAASGVTGRCQPPQIAADPGKSGSALPPWPSKVDRGRLFRNVLQILASAGTFGRERPRPGGLVARAQIAGVQPAVPAAVERGCVTAAGLVESSPAKATSSDG